jgi:hypothetical protein
MTKTKTITTGVENARGITFEETHEHKETHSFKTWLEVCRRGVVTWSVAWPGLSAVSSLLQWGIDVLEHCKVKVTLMLFTGYHMRLSSATLQCSFFMYV